MVYGHPLVPINQQLNFGADLNNLKYNDPKHCLDQQIIIINLINKFHKPRMRDLHKTRQTNITMYGKPVLSKQYKYIRLDGHISQAETMSSSRQPQSQYSSRKNPKWMNYTSSQQYQQQKKQPNMTIYNMPLKFAQQEPIFSTKFINQTSAHEELKWTKLQFEKQIISKNTFNLHYVIGKGGFGKVWKVDSKKTKKVYAMKQMYKTKIIEKKSIDSVMNQRVLLSKLKHPFLVNMTYAFQDKQNLFLIMDFLNGGDLRYHIGLRRRFGQNQAKFFIACIVLGLNYLHSNNIIHRDIKPQNLVMESNGYIRITDLGVSRQWKEDNSHNTSGTPGYMAPEVMCHKNHTHAADYFAVGVLGYQFMMGRRPYLGKSRKEIRDQILAKQAVIKCQDIPRGWSADAADFINNMLIRNPNNRLGNMGFDEVRKHPWLKNIDWNKLLRKQIKSPYVPMTIQDNYEQFQNQISQDSIADNPEQNALLLRDPEVQALFQGYEFPQVAKQKQSSTRSTRQSSSTVSSGFPSEYRQINSAQQTPNYRKIIQNSYKR